MMRLVCVVCLGLWLASGSVPASAKPWKIKEGCTLIPNQANDGDSFHIKWHTREYIFRLYFVDTPETDDNLPDRVKEQAAYFGIDEQSAIRIGKEAQKFSQKFLENKELTIWTKLDDAMGRSKLDRDYAFVKVGDRDLAESLVSNGLARIYGTDITPPEDASEKTYLWRLKTLERQAKEKKLGAWGVVAGPSSPFALPQLMNPMPTRPATPAPAQPTTPVSAQPAVPAQAQPMNPAPTTVTEQDITLTQLISVYSLKPPFPQMGYLQKGAKLRVLKAESPTTVRIRFSTSSGQIYEAMARRADLGL